MGLTIGLGGGNAGGGGAMVASGLIQDMEGVAFTGTARVEDKTIAEFTGADFRYCTSLYQMFYDCKSLVSVGELKNTSNVNHTGYMFYNCDSLQTVPAFDTSKVTNMSSMFYSCEYLQIVPLFDTSSVVIMDSMFSSCRSLKTVPLFDTSHVNNMNSMFNSCSSLTSIEGTLDMIKVTSDSNANYMFSNCKLLETVKISNLGVSLDLSYCKVLSIDSVLFLFNNAKSGVSGKTIKLNSLVFDQLTEEQIAIATEKGFSVTSVVRS